MAHAELKNPSILEFALNAPEFSILCAACQASGIAETLKVGGPYTLFAPTNAAFKRLPTEALKELLDSKNKEDLLTLLTYHVIPGHLSSKEIKRGKIRTLSGKKCEISQKEGRLHFDYALLNQPDIECSNGCIHAIDQVVIPN